MSFLEDFSDFLDHPVKFIRKIQLKATFSNLWDRTPKEKTIAVRTQSVLPQIKLTSNFLSRLWRSSTGTKLGLGVVSAEKYSPTHLLTLKAKDFHWLAPNESAPTADYLLYLALIFPDWSATLCSKLMRSVDRRLTRLEVLEPLDLCRATLGFSHDKEGERLFVQSDLVFPYVNLYFTPIGVLKIVSTPLSVRLTKEGSEEYETGYLTLDKFGRVLPLLMTDPMAQEYPLVGIWAAGIPDSSNFTGKYTQIVHPLVWTSCVHFIESSSLEKISPSPDTNTFLFLHFENRPKFFEMSCENPYWAKTSINFDLPENGSSIFLKYLREDTMDTSSPATMNSSYSSRFSSSSKPPKPGGLNTSRITIKTDRRHRSCSPESEMIIREQKQMLLELEAQVKELEAHVYNTPREKFAPIRRSSSSEATSKSFKRKLSESEIYERPPLVERLRESKETSSSEETAKEEFENEEFVERLNERSNSESTICVPKILYESSESSEEEDLTGIENKYLN